MPWRISFPYQPDAPERGRRAPIRSVGPASPAGAGPGGAGFEEGEDGTARGRIWARPEPPATRTMTRPAKAVVARREKLLMRPRRSVYRSGSWARKAALAEGRPLAPCIPCGITAGTG